MPDWSRLLGRVANEIDAQTGGLRERAGAKLGGLLARPPRAPRIAAYRGYAHGRDAFVSGRVVTDRASRPVRPGDPWWRNLAGTLRRMESDELPGVSVRIRLAGAEHTAVTDEEGYFRAWLQLDEPLPTGAIWHEGALEVVAPRMDPPVTAATHVLLPPPSATFGVISDLDDTVIRTDATSLVRMLRATLLENVHTRLPFEGVAAFYRALHDGASGSEGNPVFYVSSSPWNLYDLLVEFLALRGIPLGPVMLRDWGLAPGSLPRAHGPHKRTHITQILSFYPNLPFILIGDSGQEDPEIYRDVVAAHPDRIRAIYIRNVSRDPLRRTSMEELAHEVREKGSILVIAEDTHDAARHAAEHGWIDPARLGEIDRETEEDAPVIRPTHVPTVVVEGGETRTDPSS
jgi:phosphatidate phosphatase APP1